MGGLQPPQSISQQAAPCIDKEFCGEDGSWFSGTEVAWPRSSVFPEKLSCIDCYVTSLRLSSPTATQCSNRTEPQPHNIARLKLVLASSCIIFIFVLLHAWFTIRGSFSLRIYCWLQYLVLMMEFPTHVLWGWIPSTVTVETEAVWNVVFMLPYAPLKSNDKELRYKANGWCSSSGFHHADYNT